MDVPRVRFGAILEWALAAGCILLLAALAATTFGHFRDLPAFPPVIAGERPIPDLPASMFPRAVVVPMLLLSTGAELRVGEATSAVAGVLDEAWQIGDDVIERAAGGRERVIRRYDDGATQFAVVVEGGRVSAIYVR